MKNLFTIALFLICSASFAQETGKIYFIAKDWKCKAFIDKKIVCNTTWKYYSIHEVPVGKHQVDVQTAGKEYKANDEPVFIEVEAGKTYYFLAAAVGKGFNTNLVAQELTENSAKAMMKDMKGEEVNCLK